MGNTLSHLEHAVTSYNPDEDIERTGGMGGIKLAEAMMTVTNGNPEKFHEIVATGRYIDYLSSLMDIASRKSYKTKDIHATLIRLKKMGYEKVPPHEHYRHFGYPESKELLSDIREAISEELKHQRGLQFHPR